MRAILCDADGCLFPSEEPAFVASTEVTNRFLASLGVGAGYSSRELRGLATGRTFRVTARALANRHGVDVSAATLQRWVAEEQAAVTAHLRRVPAPDPAVRDALSTLAADHVLAAVSSSGLTRLQACFTATALDDLIPAERRFSAEDSVHPPASKPDPAVYRLALERLEISALQAVAVEDSLAGAQSAIAAGIPTIGNLTFVSPAERDTRRRQLAEAGVMGHIDCWRQLTKLTWLRATDANGRSWHRPR